MTDNSTDMASASAPGRRERLVRGGLVMTLVSVAQRLSGFIAHGILGAILFEDEFGLFAVALGLTSIGASIRSALQPVLIGHLEHDPAAFARTYRTTMAALWAFTFAGIAASGGIETLLDAEGLQPLLVVMLLTIPFQIVAGFGMARISHSLEFGSVGKTLTIMAVGRHLATVLFALAGLGPMSLALGQVVAIIIELTVLRRYTSLFIKPGLFSMAMVHDVRGSLGRILSGVDRRWIWLSAIALTLANSGQFTAAKFFASEEIIGIYYFAFGLTGAFWLPLTLSVNTVLVPGFVALRSNEERRERFVETVKILSVMGVLMFNTVTIGIVPLADVMWNGKWNVAIPAMLAFTLLAPLQFLHPVIHAIERGTGQWNLYFSDIVLTAVLTVAAAATGAYFGSPALIVILVVSGDVFVTFLALGRLGQVFGAELARVLSASVLPWILGLAAPRGRPPHPPPGRPRVDGQPDPTPGVPDPDDRPGGSALPGPHPRPGRLPGG